MSVDQQHAPFDAELVDVTDVLPPWLPALDLDPLWRIDHGLIPHSLDKALIEEEEHDVR
jgi:hypothetical protein